MKSFELNKVMLETKNNSKYKLRHLGIFYLLYVLVMVVVPMINSYLFNFNDYLSNVLISYTIATLLCTVYIVKIGRRSFLSLGMTKDKLMSNYIVGCIIAFVLLLIMWFINIMFKGINTTLNTNFNILIFLLLLIGFIFQGFMEELLLRGVIFVQLSLKFGVILGILLNSLIFALGHLGNANASYISVINTFLFGVLMSIIFYYHENLWLVSGIHSAWNFILGPVLGISVSGFNFPTTLLNTTINNDLSYLNGGIYGFEASYLFTIISVVIIIIYVLKISKR